MKEFSFPRIMNIIFESILNPVGDLVHFENEGQLFIGPDYTDRILSFQDINYTSMDISPQLWSIDLHIIEPEGLDTEITLDTYINGIVSLIQRSNLIDLVGYSFNEQEKRIEMLVSNDLVMTTEWVGKRTKWREELESEASGLKIVEPN